MEKRVYNRNPLRNAEPPVDRGVWLTGKKMYTRLGIGCTLFYSLINTGLIPYKLRQTVSGGYKRMYNTRDVDEALRPRGVLELKQIN